MGTTAGGASIHNCVHLCSRLVLGLRPGVVEAVAMETPRQHLEMIALNIARELQSSVELKEVAEGNSDILGFHAEAVIKRLIRRTVHPMLVSHGGVIDYPRQKPLKQTDVIIWNPYPAPALFEVDDFALVPRSSVFAVMEIKRSAYTDADEALEKFIGTAPGLVGVTKVHDREPPVALGVVCVLEHTPSPLMRRLLASENAIAVFEMEDGKVQVRTDDVLDLINFLHFATFRHRVTTNQRVAQLVTIKR